MTAANTDRWIRAGLVGLPIYGLLTFAASLHPQPDPQQDYPGWARFVTTNEYLIGHLLGGALGLIVAIFGVFALGARLAPSRAGRLGLAAMVITVLGNAIFLLIMCLSIFYAPGIARAYLAGVQNIEELQRSGPADLAQGLLFILVIGLSLIGNVLLGVAVWRSGLLPRWTGAVWIASAAMLYALGLIVGALFTHNSPPTEPIGALLVAIAGAGMVWGARKPDAENMVDAEQPEPMPVQS